MLLFQASCRIAKRIVAQSLGFGEGLCWGDLKFLLLVVLCDNPFYKRVVNQGRTVQEHLKSATHLLLVAEKNHSDQGGGLKK